MKIGIMQPYLFPYIGYFQLINAVDRFVIYDDVQFIKGGWINRNRVLINGQDSMFTLKIKKDDFKLKINERFLLENWQYENSKIQKSIELAYFKAPYFDDVISIIRECLNCNETNLSKFIQNSLERVCNYLDINTEMIISSKMTKDNSLKGEDKVIHINKLLDSDMYINAIGGTELYSKDTFLNNGIDLKFLKSKDIRYQQFDANKFIPNLSIIDVLMFNSKEAVNKLLNEYELI